MFMCFSLCVFIFTSISQTSFLFIVSPCLRLSMSLFVRLSVRISASFLVRSLVLLFVCLFACSLGATLQPAVRLACLSSASWGCRPLVALPSHRSRPLACAIARSCVISLCMLCGVVFRFNDVLSALCLFVVFCCVVLLLCVSVRVVRVSAYVTHSMYVY